MTSVECLFSINPLPPALRAKFAECLISPLKYAPSPGEFRLVGQKPPLMMASVLREGVPAQRANN